MFPDSNSSDEQRLREIVHAAQQQAATSERDQAKGGSSEVAAGRVDEQQVQFEGSFEAPPDIPGYRMIRKLHRGAQGVVYEAFQLSTRRSVAIKLMLGGPFAGDAERARFKQETFVLAQLRHPNIIAIHDSNRFAGYDYFVMDFVQGLPLDEHVQGTIGTADEEAAVIATLKLFVPICDAVNAAHARGVIHRDLKPGNIRVDSHGNPHVLDFGLAKKFVPIGDNSETRAALTAPGQFVGSLRWAAPEQIAGEMDRLDARTDVYALGVMLRWCRFRSNRTFRQAETTSLHCSGERSTPNPWRTR